MDIIFITGLKIYTTLGIYPWEQAIKQPIFLDIELKVKNLATIEDDSINHTVNYEEVFKEINMFLQDKSFALVETLANQVAERLLNQFAIEKIMLKVSKKNTIIPAAAVGVMITRQYIEKNAN